MSQLQFVHIYRYTYDTCTLKMQVLSCNANVRNACSVSACYEKDKLFCFQLKVELLFFTLFPWNKKQTQNNYSWLESTSQITLTLEPLIMVETSEPVKYLVHSPTSMSHPWSEGWSMVCLGFLTDRTVSSKSDLESCLGAYDCVESLLNQLYYFFLLF